MKMKSSNIDKSVNDENILLVVLQYVNQKTKICLILPFIFGFFRLSYVLCIPKELLTSCVSDTDGYTAVFSRYSLLLSFFTRKQVSK